MTLYYVHDDGETPAIGEYDLFVRASNIKDVIKFWRAYYVTRRSPDNIDEIPDQPSEGAIGWDRVPLVFTGPRGQDNLARRAGQ
jgi:hypothetical protein